MLAFTVHLLRRVAAVEDDAGTHHFIVTGGKLHDCGAVGNGPALYADAGVEELFVKDHVSLLLKSGEGLVR